MCGNCGEHVELGVGACPWCGARFSGIDQVRETNPSDRPDPLAGLRTEKAMVAVVATLVAVLVLIAALLLTRKGSGTGNQVSSGDRRSNGQTQGDGAPSTSVATTSSTTTSTTVPTTVATTTTLPGPGGVLSEPPGLLCTSLAQKGYDYTAAVAYWRAQGDPARMDVDGNGRPCETVYPASAVRAFWHT